MVSVTLNDTLNQVEHTPSVHKRILDILPGVSGGVARVMVGQPFDTIKTRLQVLGVGTQLAKTMPPEFVYKHSMDCVTKMIKHEGPLSLYKGTVAPLVGNMVLLGIHFPVFNATRMYLMGGQRTTKENFDPIKTLIAGGAGGAAGSLVSCPVELVRTKMTMQRRAMLASSVAASAGNVEVTYKGSLDCFRKVLGSYGVKGLYRGYTSTLVRDIQGYAWFFLGFEAMVQAFLAAGHGHTKEDLNYLQVMAAGVAAGFGLWGSMFPIDTIKSKMQADNLANPTYKSTMDCLRQTLKQEGQTGLWRGFSAAMYRAIPVNASIFLAVEGARQGISWMEEHGVMSKLAVPA